MFVVIPYACKCKTMLCCEHRCFLSVVVDDSSRHGGLRELLSKLVDYRVFVSECRILGHGEHQVVEDFARDAQQLCALETPAVNKKTKRSGAQW